MHLISDRSANDFQDAIPTVIRNRLSNKLSQCNAASQMCNERDDIAVKKKLVCYKCLQVFSLAPFQSQMAPNFQLHGPSRHLVSLSWIEHCGPFCIWTFCTYLYKTITIRGRKNCKYDIGGTFVDW